MALVIYGIANCDTVRKARKWCEAEGLDADFHDFRKHGLSAERLDIWLTTQSVDVLVNRRGTSWRTLSDEDKVVPWANTDVAHLRALMLDNPTLIKRPVIEHKGQVLVGFDAAVKAALVGSS